MKEEIKKSGGYRHHGSSKGDYIEYNVYYDILKSDYTTDREEALQNYVFYKLKTKIEEAIKEMK